MIIKMKKTNVSVILPTYQNSNRVKKCITLLLKSKGLNKLFGLELVVIDDTPDSSVKKVIDNFSDSIDVKYIKPKKNVGIAKARDIGIRNSKYGLIINLDSDIDIEKNTIILTINALKEHKTAAMVSGNVYWKQGNKIYELDRPRKHDRRLKIGKTTYIEMLHGRYTAFYKQAFLNVRGYDSKLFAMQGEGVDLSIKFWRNGYPLVHDNKIKVYHNREGKVKKGSFLYHGWNAGRNSKMFYSILTLIYKYNATNIDISKSNWAKTLNLESKINFGKSSEFTIISSLARILDKISRSYRLIEKSRRIIPNVYDFKPYDIFSEKKLFRDCVRTAEKRLSRFYSKVFLLNLF